MKYILSVLLLVLGTSAMAFDCVQTEAQFFGQVSDLFEYSDDYAQTGVCSFRIKFDVNQYRENQVCPLDIQEAQAATFTYDLREQTCPVSFNGQEISGYLVKKDGVVVIE